MLSFTQPSLLPDIFKNHLDPKEEKTYKLTTTISDCNLFQISYCWPSFLSSANDLTESHKRTTTATLEKTLQYTVTISFSLSIPAFTEIFSIFFKFVTVPILVYGLLLRNFFLLNPQITFINVV